VEFVREGLDDAERHLLLHHGVLGNTYDLVQLRQQGVHLVLDVDALDGGETVEIVPDDGL